MRVTFTHIGWLGICPIYVANAGRIGQLIYPQHWSLWPLMLFSQAVYGLIVWLNLVLVGERWVWSTTVYELVKPITKDISEEWTMV